MIDIKPLKSGRVDRIAQNGTTPHAGGPPRTYHARGGKLAWCRTKPAMVD
jgi:hypothetical protein